MFIVVMRHKNGQPDEIVARFPEKWLADKEAMKLNERWQDKDFAEYVVTK